MITEAIFEKGVKEKNLTVAQMEAMLASELTPQKSKSSANLKAKHDTEDFGQGFNVVSGIKDPQEKVAAARQFAETKEDSDQVKWMSGMIKKDKQEATKKDKEERLAALQAAKKDSGPAGQIILSLLGLGACGVMGFYPFPQYFIGNMMIFVLASVLGYCLVASVKPSLHTPLMSMSNAISGKYTSNPTATCGPRDVADRSLVLTGIVIIGGMYQIQGKWLYGGEGWTAAQADFAAGGVTVTQILGAVAVAISAINIAGGFAVTFRMLAMFTASDKPAKP